MPLPFCETAFLPPGNPDDVCAVMRRTMQLHEYVKQMVGYMFDCDTGNLPANEFALEICAQCFVPGMMIPYTTSASDAKAIDEEVKKIWGPPSSVGLSWWVVATELTGRFPIGFSDAHKANETGGAEEITLVVDEIPEHDHDVIVTQAEGTEADAQNAAGRFLYTPEAKYLQSGTPGMGGGGVDVTNFPHAELGTKVGGGKPHSNMPPYRAVVWIRRTSRMQV